MARRYATLTTDIWRPDAAFRGLSARQQRTYLLLMTQPGISAAGTLDLTVRRWAALSCDTRPEDILDDLDGLCAARFVVVDQETEEVLVRRFIFDDNGWRNSKRRPVIAAAAGEVRSWRIRQALLAEFRRLGMPTAVLTDEPDPNDPDCDAPSDRASDRASDDSDTDSVDNGSHLAFAQVDRASDVPSDAASDGTCRLDRVVVTVVTTDGPHPSTPIPQPAAPATAVDDAPSVEAGHSGEGENSIITAPGQSDAEAALVAEIIKARPEWTSVQIRSALDEHSVRERPWPIVAAAMRRVAADARSTSPGRLRTQGPWWSEAAAEVRTSAPRGRPESKAVLAIVAAQERAAANDPVVVAAATTEAREAAAAALQRWRGAA